MTIVSTIGPGTVIRGNVSGDGDLDIHGRVEGGIDVSGELLLGETALIRSDVHARRVTVRGAVAGNISADEAIVLEPGARVLGDLGAPQIGIRPGALVRGNVSTTGSLGADATTGTATAARATPRPQAASRPAAATARAPVAAPVRAPARPVASPARSPVHEAGASPKPLASVVTRAASAVTPRPEPTRTDAHHESAASGSNHRTPAGAQPPASVSSGSSAHDADEEAHESADGRAGGPPPPVVPALRKGAKAQLRRKTAR